MRIFLCILLSFLPFDVFAASGDCTVTTEATIGALDLEITGCEIAGQGVLAGGYYNGKFYVDVDKLDAGSLPLRTTHMKSEKFLYAEKYPQIELVLNKVRVGSDKDFTGTIKIKGISKPIAGKISFEQDKAHAIFSVISTDFGLPEMSHLGITLRERLDVKVTLHKL